jgi:AraC-like DNA-binding protein
MVTSVRRAGGPRLARTRRAVSDLRRDPLDPALVRTFGLRLGRGTIAPPQVPGWCHLVTASEGRATLRTRDAAFPLVAGTGAWLPAGLDFSVTMDGPGELRLLYIPAGALPPRDASLLGITPLLAALVARTVALGALDRRIAAHARLAAVIVDEIAALATVDLHLPLPRNGPAREAAALLMSEDGSAPDLDAVARLCGVSRRTLERAFAREVGIGFALWARRVRFVAALAALERGAPVIVAALDAGYAGPSAFIAAFKRRFGVTPSRFAATHPNHPAAATWHASPDATKHR